LEIRASTLDDLLYDVYEKLLNDGEEVIATKGTNFEIDSVLLHLDNPLARISRTETRSLIFSCLGELIWYLSGSNDLSQIEFYIPNYGAHASDDGKTVHGAYGPRLLNSFGVNQINNIISLLTKKPSSRRAVIQLFQASDLQSEHKDIPCTCSLQFLVRHEQLNLITFMRSNDAYMGLPHDIFSFTMLQEIIARTLGLKLGSYTHFVGSLHLYADKVESAKHFLSEGLQSTQRIMPEMPAEPWPSIELLINLERSYREGESVDDRIEELAHYWRDLSYLLKAHACKDSVEELDKLYNLFTDDVFKLYIYKKIQALT